MPPTPKDITRELQGDVSDEVVPLTSPMPGRDSGKPNSAQWVDELPPELEPYLQTPPSTGLTDGQAAERLERFGRNELKQKKRNKILHFLSFCKEKPKKEARKAAY